MAYTNENQQLMQKLSGEISKVIKGKGEAVQLILTALLAQGHVLIEDVPGVGKTTLAMALGKATGLSFRRAQFTPDVMASDITGFTMFNREENRFEYRSGLVMTNILLADEINRKHSRRCWKRWRRSASPSTAWYTSFPSRSSLLQRRIPRGMSGHSRCRRLSLTAL